MQRLEVRLEPELHERLRYIAEERNESMSNVIRELIDRAYEELDRARRLRAVEELSKMNLFDVGEPEDLEREIETMYDGLPGLR